MDITIPDNIKYTREHEWAGVEEKVVTIGITDFAQDQLGDIVFIDLPQVGEEIIKNDTFGVVESVKSVSDLFSPISGRIREVNEMVLDSPEVVNDDCYGEGWLIKVDATDLTELDELMNKEEYEAYLKEISE